MAFDRETMRRAAASLAADGVFIGTSSWKYPGWRGLLYDEARYVWRGRFAESRFEKNCLAEYAEVFKTVCVDAAYYRFPDERSLATLASQVPEDFQFAFKVAADVTIKSFPNLPRFGARAGLDNPNFLNADLFAGLFLRPCETIRSRVGLLIFEFSQFHGADFWRGRDFVAALDLFLGALPRGWRYGVEIRNANFLQPDYFAALARHGVAHIYSSWADMPGVAEQLALPGSRTATEFAGMRLLLRPGRRYEEAVSRFSPYDRVQDANPEGRAAAAARVRRTRGAGRKTRAFIYINNRFEGCALETIAGIIEQAATPA